MSNDDYDYEREDPDESEVQQRPRDRKIDDAKAALIGRFFTEELNVYYARQLEIWMEKEFFHWITKQALNELMQEGRVGFTEEHLEHHKAHFYYPRSHRYHRR